MQNTVPNKSPTKIWPGLLFCWWHFSGPVVDGQVLRLVPPMSVIRVVNERAVSDVRWDADAVAPDTRYCMCWFENITQKN